MFNPDAWVVKFNPAGSNLLAAATPPARTDRATMAWSARRDSTGCRPRTCPGCWSSSFERPITVELPVDVELYDNFLAMLSVSMGDIGPSIEVGAVAPAFELVDQDGITHASSAYRGRIMMLDWWGVW